MEFFKGQAVQKQNEFWVLFLSFFFPLQRILIKVEHENWLLRSAVRQQSSLAFQAHIQRMRARESLTSVAGHVPNVCTVS